MATELNYSISPVKPYDESIWDYLPLYDNIPFVWNVDNEKRLTLESGNIIKGYRCKIKEPYEIKN